METEVKSLAEQLDKDFPDNPVPYNVYADLAQNIMRMAITGLTDELFLKAVIMARAIRDFGDELEKT